MVFKASNCTPVNMRTSGRWRAVGFLIAAELFEEIAFLAIATKLITYLTRQLHEGIPTSFIDVYNLQISASFFLAISGGFIADTSWGRFWPMLKFSLSFLLGMFVLTSAETIKALKPPPRNIKMGKECEKLTSKGVGFFWLALVFVAISVRGSTASLSIDQFDGTVPTERPMLVSFSTCWFMCLSCSALVAQSTIKDYIGWRWGFGLPTVGFLTVSKSSGEREENADRINQGSTEPASNLWKQNPLSQVEYVQRVVQSLPRWFIFVPAAGVKPRNWPLSSLSRVILWNPTPGTNAAAFQPLYKALPLLHSTLNMYLDVCLRERTSCLPFAANWCWYVAASSCHGGCSNSGGQTTEGSEEQKYVG
ncbi:hypothetical protein KC19_9G065500 [Ceratodon purpureus]|nr:hypothetical protein KC19_9G065500 [Ceratodon purpureus]